MKFKLVSNFKPTGDQPQAIKKLNLGLKQTNSQQTLLGVTGSGKTFTMANVIAQANRPALIISHNKTLAAQLASEFQDFFPNNAVHYFVSYYDYYQPEAYIPRTDTYIEKETQINEEIDRLRHASTTALMMRRDVIIVASVSCIYGLGNPIEYADTKLFLQTKNNYIRSEILRTFNDMRYERNDSELKRNTYRVKGELIEIYPSFALDKFWRFTFFGNSLEKIEEIDWLTKKPLNNFSEVEIYPATHYVAPPSKIKTVTNQIRKELTVQLNKFKKQNKLLEAQRLKQRVTFDLEMMETVGYCSGIENYSRFFDGRQAGQPAYTLMDYFPKDYLLFIDESHMTLPQIRAMYEGDRVRKETLVGYGFRLPAALDNRPLTYTEFTKKINQVIYVSATPSKYELEKSNQIVEQLIRPTGLLDPSISVRPTTNQIDDLIDEIKKRTSKKQRVLVTTLTKRLAEELSEYLIEMGIKTTYLHSEINTMERIDILQSLRRGEVDVLVGINLLREGLDLPEVSLVAILDADKEGFLRSDTALVQTMGRAARHAEGQVIMYADTITGSMRRAIDETKRRRHTQQKYNIAHHITPQSIQKEIKNIMLAGTRKKTENIIPRIDITKLAKDEIIHFINELREQMEIAAKNLEFEKAARLRDTINEIQTNKKID
jgi:excinuclease ABC subunit B